MQRSFRAALAAGGLLLAPMAAAEGPAGGLLLPLDGRPVPPAGASGEDGVRLSGDSTAGLAAQTVQPTWLSADRAA